ncbi:MAG: exosortase [Desulfomonilia bacterium]
MISAAESSYIIRPSWYLVLFVVLTMLLYAPTFMELALLWAGNEDYNHGFLIIPVSAYLVWRRRRQLMRLPLHSSPLGIVLLALWAAFYLLGTGAQILMFECCSLILFLLGTLLFTAGVHFTRAVLFPVVFLIFMLPVPAEVYTVLTSPLQAVTTGLSAHILNLIDIPVLREGNLIHLPNYSMQVAVACSGIRSLISIITLSLLMGYLLFSSNVERALLILLSVPVAMIGNILRITTAGLIVYRFSPGLAEGYSHTLAGMVTFSFAFVFLLGGVFLVRWIERKRMQYISWFLR